ncbi:MAG: ATP-dependent helicase [Coriobacteriales bacterium]|jgi:DNA helicase-2/ATP-dependent DNA helicase PcrA|nr:ATP-dependent helicase [Coriobacteriales bacterium]
MPNDTDSAHSMTAVDTALAQLNAEQRLAVETLDGPVLVVAGPGTGKTQLLSLRVVTILRNRDVLPKNILCLTYTNAGVEAMTKRLAGFIGRDAYGVRIATFHSFAEAIFNEYPQFFERSALDSAITALQIDTIIAKFLDSLSISDPLYQAPQMGVNRNLKAVVSFISSFKRSGLTVEQLENILNQNREACAYIAADPRIKELINTNMNLGKTEKLALCAQLQDTIAEIASAAPQKLTQPLVATPGIYIPLITYFAREFGNEPLCDDLSSRGSTARLSELKRAFFKKDASGHLVLKAHDEAERMLSMLALYSRYQQHLSEHHKHDFDDMILDAIFAIEHHPELRHQLIDTYQYLLVDEFQDTNGSQMRLLDLICGFTNEGEVPGGEVPGGGVSAAGTDDTTDSRLLPNIMVVGDDDQAIMRFQGASVEYINQFENHYKPGSVKRIVLKQNYRSTPAIVNLAGTVVNQISNRSAASRQEKQLVAAKTGNADRNSHSAINAPDNAGVRQDGTNAEQDGSSVEPLDLVARIYPNKDLQYFEVARDIAQLLDAGFLAQAADPATALAIVASRHVSLTAMIPYLNHFGVPFEYVRRSSLAHVASAQTLFACMRFAAAVSRARFDYAQQYLPQILAAPEFGIPAVDFLRFALAVRATKKSWLEALLFCSQHKRREKSPAGQAGQTMQAEQVKQVKQAEQAVQTEPNKQAEQELIASAGPALMTLFAYVQDTAAKAASQTLRDALLTLAKPLIAHYDAMSKNDPYALMELNYSLAALLKFATEERGEPGSLGPSSRLADLVELLDQAERYDYKIDIAIPLAQSDAITLCSAHGSKGLEFDKVYLIDADQRTWHNKESGEAISASNLLFGTSKDANDTRRLLYVALSRARYQIQASTGGSDIVGELLDSYEQERVKPDAQESAIQAQVDWQQSYYPQNPDLLTLFKPILNKLRLSPSLLNSFVAYDPARHDHRDFILDRVVRLPERPSVAREFGTLMHQFMEDYINRVLKAGSLSLEHLKARTLARLNGLDLGKEDKRQMEERLDAVIAQFLPHFCELIRGELRSEQWFSTELDGVPVTGKSDLLEFDRAHKRITVYDFKTGKPGDKTAGYTRQLQFYKLLIENLPEYDGYTVTAGADLFIEPIKAYNWQIAPVEYTPIGTEELEHLRWLIKAVWARLQSGHFDTSGFEDSPHKAAVLSGNTKSNGEPKTPKKSELQAAFEQWLIDEYRRVIIDND